MKNIIKLILLSVVLFKSTAYAQSVIKTEIKVSGVCEDCKQRIEEAANQKGVKEAIYDKKKQTLSIVYNPKRTNLDEITSRILNIGHDANGLTAPDSIYNQLPECCQYRHGKQIH